jgi:hypothetical protein
VQIARQLDAGVLLVSDKSIFFVPASEISIMKRTKMQYRHIGIVGYLNGFGK